MSGEAAAIGCAFCWALSSAVIRNLTNQLPSLLLNALRCLVGTIFYLLIVFISGREVLFGSITASDLLYLSINLGLGIILGDTAYYASMRLIGLSRALTISSVYPLLTALLAWAFLDERFMWKTWVGFVLCVVGVVVVARSGLGNKGETTAGPRLLRGLILALIAAALWSVGTVALRRGSVGLDPFVVNSVRLGGVALIAGSWAGLRGDWASLRGFRWKQVWQLTASSVIGSLIGTTLYLVAVQKAGASKGAVLASVAPLFSVPLSLFAGESINRRLIIGMVMAVAGVMLVV